MNKHTIYHEIFNLGQREKKSEREKYIEEVIQTFSEMGFGVYPVIKKSKYQFVLIIEKR